MARNAASAEETDRVRRVVRRLIGYYELNLTQVGEVLGVVPQNAGNKINGKTDLRLGDIFALARLFGVPPEILLNYTPNEALRWVIDNRPEISSSRQTLTSAALVAAS